MAIVGMKRKMSRCNRIHTASWGMVGALHLGYNFFVKYRELLRLLHEKGWRHERTTGSHMMMIHPTHPGPIVVPAGGKEGQDVPKGTLNSILRQAGIK